MPEKPGTPQDATSGGSPPLSQYETLQVPETRRDRTPSDVFHGRFVPGTLLGERYRIVGLLGQGGMGEVYRADDLELGQSVALKFLARATEDAASLERFRGETGIARLISHPNVCRVYDLDQWQGEHFITMEYIHGEDLATLLNRIGRISPDKALQIARQICAGLSAAHDKGMLHRDLKPANIMLDERGVARISDFGLAGLARGQNDAVRGGTPAYMAPEQLAGGPASVRSDIYALGLVLYELFTGRPPFKADTLAQLRQLREETTPPEPSALVENLDPAVERVILRCLERAPKDRPVSIPAVAAALPGGDPLAAALAAGETPLPEMVAAAGEEVGIEPHVALVGLIALFVSAGLASWLAARESLASRIALPNSPEVLIAKARETIQRLGLGEQSEDSAFGFRVDSDYARYVGEKDKSKDRWRATAVTRPPLLHFWYRESPRPLEPEMFFGGGRVTRSDPPETLSNMRSVELDPMGRLVYLNVVPPQVETPMSTTHEVDWSALFVLAGLDETRFRSVAPRWRPPGDLDLRVAWEGSFSERPELALRVEAGAYRGQPAWFEIVGPWSRPSRMQEVRRSAGEQAGQIVSIAVLTGTVVGALLLARRSLRLARGDRRSAWRLASFILLASVLQWSIAADHVRTRWELGLIIMAASWALFTAALVWVFYIAAEPYVRRRWPHVLISWTRLAAGRFGDPLLGRDLLLGSLAGAVMAALLRLRPLLSAQMGGLPSQPLLPSTPVLGGARYALSLLLSQFQNALFSGLAVMFLIVVLRAFLRRDWLATIVFLLCFVLGPVLSSDEKFLEGALSLAVWGIALLVLRRAGLTALVLTFFTANAVMSGPMSGDLSAWHTRPSLVSVLTVAAIAAFGFWRALAGRSLFKGSLLEA